MVASRAACENLESCSERVQESFARKDDEDFIWRLLGTAAKPDTRGHVALRPLRGTPLNEPKSQSVRDSTTRLHRPSNHFADRHVEPG